MQKKLIETKRHIYKATSVLFLFQLFGALGAGFLFVAGNILGIEFLKAGQPMSETLWHLFFWATDFFCVALVCLLSYYIAGLPALTPALTLSLYFAHFAGQYANQPFEPPLYNAFFATPQSGGGGLNIGYMGYLLMALLLGYLIKNLFALWDKIKNSLGPKLDNPINKIGKKNKALQGTPLKGIALLEALDLIVLFLILPIISALLTYFFIYYLIYIPFNSLGNILESTLIQAHQSGNALGGLLSGAMVGFDIIGPLSMSAFRAAANMAAAGNGAAMTGYALSFASMGWLPLAAFLLGKVSKKGESMDTDDMNIAMSGPINAFFDNMKLTVSFSMTFAMRDPLRVITAYVCSGSITGLLVSTLSLSNKNYITDDFVQKFLSGEIYVSFTQPLRSISSTPRGLLLPVCAGLGVLIGAGVLIFLKELAHKRRLKNDISFEPNGDIVLEIRELSQSFNKKNPPTKAGDVQSSEM